MPFFPVSDDAAFHAKLRAAGNAAVGLWTRAGAYSMFAATDGILQRHELDGLGTPGQARKLVEVVLWHAHAHECERCPQPPKGGWIFHDWTHHGPIKTSGQIKDYRAKAAERQRNKRARDRDAVSHGVTNDVTHASPSPRPLPVLPVTSQSLASTARAIDGLTDIDLETIRRRLGNSCPEMHAAQVAIQILARSQVEVLRPLRYILAAIDAEPDRYRPTPGPPRADECCPLPGHGSYAASNCGACRANAIGADA